MNIAKITYYHTIRENYTIIIAIRKNYTIIGTVQVVCNVEW